MALFVTILFFVAFTIRNLINFSQETPLHEYISPEELVAMVYDLVYFYSIVSIIFIGIILVMLLFLILKFLDYSEGEPQKVKPKKATTPQKKKPEKKKPEKKKAEAPYGTKEEWKKLYKVGS